MCLPCNGQAYAQGSSLIFKRLLGLLLEACVAESTDDDDDDHDDDDDDDDMMMIIIIIIMIKVMMIKSPSAEKRTCRKGTTLEPISMPVTTLCCFMHHRTAEEYDYARLPIRHYTTLCCRAALASQP